MSYNSPFWTVAESCCWIACGSAETVNQLGDGARRSVVAADDIVPGAFNARLDLLNHLQGGRLIATAFADGATVRAPIEPLCFVDADFEEGSEGTLAVLRRGPHLIRRWDDIRLRSERVRDLWSSRKPRFRGEKSLTEYAGLLGFDLVQLEAAVQKAISEATPGSSKMAAEFHLERAWRIVLECLQSGIRSGLYEVYFGDGSNWCRPDRLAVGAPPDRVRVVERYVSRPSLSLGVPVLMQLVPAQ